MTTESLQEPWCKHEAMLAERRPFQLNSLRCTAQASSTTKSYSAVIRCSLMLTDVCMLSQRVMRSTPFRRSLRSELSL